MCVYAKNGKTYFRDVAFKIAGEFLFFFTSAVEPFRPTDLSSVFGGA